MEAYERPETVGEAVTPQEEAIAPDEGETGTDLAERSAGEGQSHEENRRYQAARRQGERSGYDRALREINARMARSAEDREAALEEFIARDVESFAQRFPGVSPAELDGDAAFRRFCGSRYAREPLAELYGDYLALAAHAGEAAVLRSESRSRRATGAGGGTLSESLTAREQQDLDEWNRAFPEMRMTAKEFRSR